MTDTDKAVAEFLANGGRVTQCPPANANGNEASKASRADVARQRREWRKAQAEACRQSEE